MGVAWFKVLCQRLPDRTERNRWTTKDEEFSMPAFDPRAFRKFSSANSTLQASDDGVT